MKQSVLFELPEEKPDFTVPNRSPSLAVACPQCKAKIGVRCKRPSEHDAQNLHKDRHDLADKTFEEMYPGKDLVRDKSIKDGYHLKIVNGDLEKMKKKKQDEADARNKEIEKQRQQDMISGYWHETRAKVPTVIYVREVETPGDTFYMIWQAKDVDSTGSRLFNPLMPLSKTREIAEAKLERFAKKNGLKKFRYDSN